MLLNVMALTISILSLLAATYLAARQYRITRHANELPILVQLTQELRSSEFQEAEDYALRVLEAEHSCDLGITNLPIRAKTAVTTLLTFYSSFGAYIILGLADEKVIVSLFGFRANRAWVALEKYIQQERILRNDSEYVAYFEDLVCRVREHWPPPKTYGILLLKMRDDMGGPRGNPILPDAGQNTAASISTVKASTHRGRLGRRAFP